jgi:hypothetical protein
LVAKLHRSLAQRIAQSPMTASMSHAATMEATTVETTGEVAAGKMAPAEPGTPEMPDGPKMPP